MNEYLTIVVGIILLYQAVMAFTGSDKYLGKLKGKYTPESIATYSKVNGAGALIAGLLFIYAGLNQLGVLKIGPDFNEGNTELIVYVVALVVLIALLIIGRVVCLKPLDGAQGGKQNNLEDEDY